MLSISHEQVVSNLTGDVPKLVPPILKKDMLPVSLKIIVFSNLKTNGQGRETKLKKQLHQTCYTQRQKTSSLIYKSRW